VTPELRQTR